MMADSNASEPPADHEGDSGQVDVAPVVSRNEIFKALEAVERDSAAISDSFSSLFASLRVALSQATSSTAEHMSCFTDAAGRVQETVLDASTKGNRYINSCLRLNEEMKGMDTLATQLMGLFDPGEKFKLLGNIACTGWTEQIYIMLAYSLDKMSEKWSEGMSMLWRLP